MEIFAKDLIFDDFRASDYGLCIASFSDNGSTENEVPMAPSVIEKYIGFHPTPIYLGMQYEEKLKPTITFIKNPSIFNTKLAFTQKEIRGILRKLTGFKGYHWLKLIDYLLEEDIWYKARISGISYQKVGGDIVGIILEMECDSPFGYSTEHTMCLSVKENTPFYVYNDTDDLHNYVFPYAEIKSFNNGKIEITNISDNSWTTELSNMKSEEIVSMDSQREILTSNIVHSKLLNDFNLHWIRLVPDKNEFISNADITLKLVYRVPRKAGFA